MFGSWQPLSLLGEGGQGAVYRALDTRRVNLINAARALSHGLETARGIGGPDKKATDLIAAGLHGFRLADEPGNHGALKILHEPDEKARQRLDAEARAYQAVKHPHLIRLLDYNRQEGWLVTALQTGGTLDGHRGTYRADPLGALTALRPIIEAVGALHGAGIIHRDIKPANIFLRGNGDLVLGDAGIVYFADSTRTRPTDTLENVGSRDWMPGWATGMRVENIHPTFDLFSLGKVLWSLVSGQPLLRFWYHRLPEFNLETMFPDDPRMPRFNTLLDQVIVEFEQNMAFTTAAAFLSAIDDTASVLAQPSPRAPDTARDAPKAAASTTLGIAHLSLAKPRDHLRVADVSDNGPPDRQGDVLVRGRVFNDSTILTIRAVQVAIDAVDSTGTKLGSKDTFTTPTHLGPEEAGSFQAYVRVSRPHDYRTSIARILSAQSE
jgi:serine/threonine protein kinase